MAPHLVYPRVVAEGAVLRGGVSGAWSPGVRGSRLLSAVSSGELWELERRRDPSSWVKFAGSSSCETGEPEARGQIPRGPRAQTDSGCLVSLGRLGSPFDPAGGVEVPGCLGTGLRSE